MRGYLYYRLRDEIINKFPTSKRGYPYYELRNNYLLIYANTSITKLRDNYLLIYIEDSTTN